MHSHSSPSFLPFMIFFLPPHLINVSVLSGNVYWVEWAKLGKESARPPSRAGQITEVQCIYITERHPLYAASLADWLTKKYTGGRLHWVGLITEPSCCLPAERHTAWPSQKLSPATFHSVCPHPGLWINQGVIQKAHMLLCPVLSIHMCVT